jgi:transcriptional regulator with XRE-family HTH domain
MRTTEAASLPATREHDVEPKVIRRLYMESPEPVQRIELLALGQTVQRLRIARGWSRPQLADAVQRSPKSVQRWETGQQEMGVLDAAAIAKALGVSLQALVAPETPALVRTSSLFFVSPARLERVRAAKSAEQLRALLASRPTVGVEIEPADVLVSREQFEATQSEADRLYDSKVRGPLQRLLAKLRS